MQGPINSFGKTKLSSYLLFNADCSAVPLHFYADVTGQIGGSWRFDGHLLEYLLGPLFLQCVATLCNAVPPPPSVKVNSGILRHF